MSLNVTQPCLYERDVFAVSCLSLEGPGLTAYSADAVNVCENNTCTLRSAVSLATLSTFNKTSSVSATGFVGGRASGLIVSRYHQNLNYGMLSLYMTYRPRCCADSKYYHIRCVRTASSAYLFCRAVSFWQNLRSCRCPYWQTYSPSHRSLPSDVANKADW